MEEKLVTLAILTFSKAQILKSVLESEGIEAYIHNVNQLVPVISSGVRVRIKESDLPHALEIVEDSEWLSDKPQKDDSQRGNVLIPVDFSSYSMKACSAGFKIAATLNADVTLMNVYFSPAYMPTLQFAIDLHKGAGMRALTEKAQTEMNVLTAALEKKMEEGELPRVEYKCVLRDGIPEEEILRYSKKEKPLVIVMGTRGESQKDLELIGSVTAEVIDRCPCFVYAIPENAPEKVFSNVEKVALITNFDQRDLIAFDRLIRTFKSYHFKADLVHLNTKDDQRVWNEIKLAGIKEYFTKHYPEQIIGYSIIDEDHLLNNLDDYVRENHIDVLCITNYKRNVFAQLFNPSIARKMLFHSDTPILIIK